MTPQAFRTGGDGEVIRSAVGASSLGPVLVAMADKGVCAVLLDGDAGRTLLPRLVEMFPRAEHRADPGALGGLVSRALTRADVPEPGRELLPRPGSAGLPAGADPPGTPGSGGPGRARRGPFHAVGRPAPRGLTTGAGPAHRVWTGPAPAVSRRQPQSPLRRSRSSLNESRSGTVQPSRSYSSMHCSAKPLYAAS